MTKAQKEYVKLRLQGMSRLEACGTATVRTLDVRWWTYKCDELYDQLRRWSKKFESEP